MQSETFVSNVMANGPQLQRDTAQQAVQVTLQALCEHMPPEQTRRMASQLPEAMADAAQAGAQDAGGNGQQLDDIKTFYRKVAARADISPEEARGISRAVAHTLKQAVSDGEMVDVIIDLPTEMAELVAFN